MSITIPDNLYPLSAVGTIFTSPSPPPSLSRQIQSYFETHMSDFFALLKLANYIYNTHKHTKKCYSISLEYEPETPTQRYFCGNLQTIRDLLPPLAAKNKFYYILDAALVYDRYKMDRPRYIQVDSCYGSCEFYYPQADEFYNSQL